MLKAVIFDVDGTLIDSVEAHARAWIRTFQHFGVDAALEDVRREIGRGGDQLMPSFVPPDVLEARGEKIEAYRVDLFKREHLPMLKAFSSVPQLFERIRADGLAIALASSAKADELERYVDIAKIKGLFDAATSSDDADKSKPFPDIFEAAAARLKGVSLGQCVVVGDTPYDAEAARAGGAACIGVLSGGFSEDSLRAVGCQAIYRNVQALLEDYDRSPLGGA